MIDYYTNWEWQPLENMSGGCHEVVIGYSDGSTEKMCSCDFHLKEKGAI